VAAVSLSGTDLLYRRKIVLRLARNRPELDLFHGYPNPSSVLASVAPLCGGSRDAHFTFGPLKNFSIVRAGTKE
jgi:hypothetical protein